MPRNAPAIANPPLQTSSPRDWAAIVALSCCILLFFGSLPSAIRLRPVITSTDLGTNPGPDVGFGPGNSDSVFPPMAPDFTKLFTVLGTALFVLIVAGIGWGLALWLRPLLLRRYRSSSDDDGARFTSGTSELAVPLPPERAANRIKLANLEQQPSDRIVAIWVELERVASTQVGIRPANITPAEWARERLQHFGADGEAIETLLTLYHRARFRPATVSTSSEITAAEQALAAIMASLDAGKESPRSHRTKTRNG